MAERTGEVRAGMYEESSDWSVQTQPGFVVAVEQEAKKDGQPTVFNAKQIPTVNSLPIAPSVNAQAVHEIDFSFGPVKERLILPYLKSYSNWLFRLLAILIPALWRQVSGLRYLVHISSTFSATWKTVL